MVKIDYPEDFKSHRCRSHFGAIAILFSMIVIESERETTKKKRPALIEITILSLDLHFKMRRIYKTTNLNKRS